MAPKASKAAKEDKPKQKKAPTPYIIYCTEKRAELVKANPDASFGTIGKLLGEGWRNMDEKTKAVCTSIAF